MSQLSRFFYRYKNFWGAVLIILGVIFAFFGNKVINLVIFLTGAFAVFIILSSLFVNYALKKVDKNWVLWVAIVVIALIAIGGGILLRKFRKVGVSLFAAWGGVMLGFLVTTTFAVANVYAFYAILIAGAIGMFFITYKLEQVVVIMLTAFIGSYALIRGISLYAGGFPSEASLHEEIASHAITWKQMPKAFYGYLVGIVILTILTSWF